MESVSGGYPKAPQAPNVSSGYSCGPLDHCVAGRILVALDVGISAFSFPKLEVDCLSSAPLQPSTSTRRTSPVAAKPPSRPTMMRLL